MVYSIEVYGAFDFLKEAVRVGVLEYERIKGNASYRFNYEDAFLAQFPSIRLSADLGFFWASIGPGGHFLLLGRCPAGPLGAGAHR